MKYRILASWFPKGQCGGVTPNRRKFRRAKSRTQKVTSLTRISETVVLAEFSSM